MDHEVGPWKMAFSHGPTSMVQALHWVYTECGSREVNVLIKNRWTMSVENWDLELCLLGTSNSLVTLTFGPKFEIPQRHIFLGVNQSGLGWVQQPITDFTVPWDDFMVHGVNNPYVYEDEQKVTQLFRIPKVPYPKSGVGLLKLDF